MTALHRKGARDNNAVKARNNAVNLILMEFYERAHNPYSNRRDATEGSEYDIFLVPARAG